MESYCYDCGHKTPLLGSSVQLRRQKERLRRKVREGRQRPGRMPGEVGKHRTTEPLNQWGTRERGRERDREREGSKERGCREKQESRKEDREAER